MAREVFIIRDRTVVWRGDVAADNKSNASTRERFQEAWRRALNDGAVTELDAGFVRFRFSFVAAFEHA